METTLLLRLFSKSLVILVLTITSSTLSAQQTAQEKRDSLHQVIPTLEGEEKLNAYLTMTNIDFTTVSTPEEINALIELYDAFEMEAKRQQNIRFQTLVKGNILILFRNRAMFDEVIQRAPEYIDFAYKNEQWTLLYRMYESYITAKKGSGKVDEALAIAQELYEQAKEANQSDGMGIAIATIGDIYSEMERYEESIDHYRQAIGLLEKIEPVHLNLPTIYFFLCQDLLSLNRFDEAQKELLGYEKANKRALEYKQMPANNPNAINLLITYARYYVLTEQYDKAELYCDSLENIGDIPHIENNVCQFRLHIYEARGQYDKALEMSERMDQYADGEINAYHTFRMTDRARLLSRMNRGEESFDLMREVLHQSDSLRNMDFNKQLDEVRTRYEVDRHILEKERTRSYFYFALVGCALLLIALTIWILYSRRLRAKNRALYQQIQARNQCRIVNENTLIARPKEELTREMNLYRELSLLMKREKLFTDPNLDRRVLAERLGTNEKYIADAIHSGSQETLSAYITRLRLQYATELLDSQPDLTLEAIALDAGFSSYRTFFRAFSQSFGMTPRDYRLFAQR
ncbi:AraC family transcriptional regulator [Parabacteroides sp. PF5-6]|uniref:AraC family transcriptional regulator n=1 Tax=Parabacteroides sp. PF5-6 TaxID=1742403 RepID=UPI0024073B54|nr:AraC family transcriptional regulator [Parabacteroides sp. PF5-6]MDF9828902.1 AraC-like DNA-binding protein [Parabacteroides sp. PF5-6]